MESCWSLFEEELAAEQELWNIHHWSPSVGTLVGKYEQPPADGRTFGQDAHAVGHRVMRLANQSPGSMLHAAHATCRLLHHCYSYRRRIVRGEMNRETQKETEKDVRVCSPA